MSRSSQELWGHGPSEGTKPLEGDVIQGASPDLFLAYLRENVPIEALLDDRQGQAALDRLLSDEFRSSRKPEGPINPYPILALEVIGDGSHGTHYTHSVFMLRDREYYYYFLTLPLRDDEHFVRPSDSVPSGRFREDTGEEVPFNKPIRRVLARGGLAENYNYNTAVWEKNHTTWTPPMKTLPIPTASI